MLVMEGLGNLPACQIVQMSTKIQILVSHLYDSNDECQICALQFRWKHGLQFNLNYDEHLLILDLTLRIT